MPSYHVVHYLLFFAFQTNISRAQPSAAERPGSPGSAEQSEQSLPLCLHQHARLLRPPALHHGREDQVREVLPVQQEREDLLLITRRQKFSTNKGKRQPSGQTPDPVVQEDPDTEISTAEAEEERDSEGGEEID